MSLTIFSLIVLLFSIILHEIAHGSMALRLGDSTAKHAGRLTLNPLKHIDLFGTIILPFLLVIIRSPFIIGWAKPVPVNPYNLRDPKWGMLKVSLAGPSVNFLLAIIFGLIIRFVPLPEALASFFGIIVFYNFLLGIFNLIPIPPLDGSHILFAFLSDRFNNLKVFLSQYGIFIFIFFLFFGWLDIIFQGAAILFYLTTSQPF
ncbi:MAG: site-2 protease family protein [Candidatus Nealsonbacteria bacterium]|nr:site-2 protease family protein [Candidatus Nealsonbacteria bacterium]